MDGIKIPVGNSDFNDIQSNGYYYIDKSGLICELLKTPGTKLTLVTRPRRFGKTLGMSMLSEFFDIRKNSKSLFYGLIVSEEKELCNKWQNRYPTLFLTFKDVSGNTFENAYGLLKFVLAQVCVDHADLEMSEHVDNTHKEIFRRLKTQESSITDVQSSIYILMNMMQAHYGKPVILLLDEYDVPIAKASSNGYYNEMLEIIKAMMSTSLKDNSALQFAVVTGCLRIAKESVFTGTNNFVSDTISDTRLNEYFGFTQSEVEQILLDANLQEHALEIREWYNGYHFGKFDVYCPWDVMNHVNALILDHTIKPKGYWKNSSDNAIIRSFIDMAGTNITKQFETLLSGGYIIQKVEEDLTYDYLHSSEENLWSILYLTGYLTRVSCAEMEQKLMPGELALAIPNLKIKDIFRDTIKKWFEDNARIWNKKILFDAVWSKDADKATTEITRLLRKTISYYDYQENFYHAFWAGIFAGAGYIVESNKEHGEGRSDIIVQDYSRSCVVIFEAKYSKKLTDLAIDCEKALNQIDHKKYADTFEEEYETVICYGIAFYKKRCMVRCE
ncbi:ATP-binding protein [Lachnospiraceae bacterium OttesenSCG-928-D06]|nr:ATP-binding protein [Lachnospiraceae bacterium OttesenSCG-928-D06]